MQAELEKRLTIFTSGGVSYNFDVSDQKGFCLDLESNLDDVDFNFENIFNVICETFKKEGYNIPNDEKSFNESPIWNDIGVILAPYEKIVQIQKDYTMYHPYTYGELAGYIIDFDKSEVYRNHKFDYHNRLDSLMFEDWPRFDMDGNEGTSGDVLEQLEYLYHAYLAGIFSLDELIEKSREYLESLVTSDFEDEAETGKLSEEQIQSVLDILNEVLGKGQ